MCATMYHPLPNQLRIQDFPEVGAKSQVCVILQIFAENCMKMKEFGRPRDASLTPLLGSANANPPDYCTCG